jgi:hypothetical protein
MGGSAVEGTVRSGLETEACPCTLRSVTGALSFSLGGACFGMEFSIKEGFLDSFVPLERETGTAWELAQEKNMEIPGSNRIKDTSIVFRIYPYRRLAVNSSGNR